VRGFRVAIPEKGPTSHRTRQPATRKGDACSRRHDDVEGFSTWPSGSIRRGGPRCSGGAVARGETDQRLLRDLVDLAIEGNEDDAALPKYREALRAGRRVKIANYPVTFLSFDGVDADLVYQIEEVFRYAD
jgi:hypothetical protein